MRCIIPMICFAVALTACDAFTSGEELATQACESFIQTQLRSPSTYTRVEVAHAPHEPGKSFRYVSVLYDADNAFGTPIRGGQVCAFKVDPQSGKFPSKSMMNLSASLANSEKALREVKAMAGQKVPERPANAFDCCVAKEDEKAAADSF